MLSTIETVVTDTLEVIPEVIGDIKDAVANIENDKTAAAKAKALIKDVIDGLTVVAKVL